MKRRWGAGRTKAASADLTPAEHAALRALLTREGLSLADWIVRQTQRAEAERAMTKPD